MAKKIVIVGGGWAGSAAALAARKAGCEVEVFERTDMLLGTGLVGGIMRNNGRFTATEEMLAMGGGDLFQITDEISRHRNMEFPGHKHASLYDVARAEPTVKRALIKAGVTLHLHARVKDIEKAGDKITKVIAEGHHGDPDIAAGGDTFVDAAGTAGPQGNCLKYGNGCVMCIYRCPTFGPRFSIAAKAGVPEIMGAKADGTLGAMSGSCKLLKESLSDKIVDELNRTGVCVVAVPTALQKSMESLGQKACQQYALKEFAENVVLLDTGHAKLMTAYYPLDMLRQIPGFENARFEDPYSGGIGNSMRYLGMLPRDNALKVDGLAERVLRRGEGGSVGRAHRGNRHRNAGWSQRRPGGLRQGSDGNSDQPGLRRRHRSCAGGDADQGRPYQEVYFFRLGVFREHEEEESVHDGYKRDQTKSG